MYILFIYYFSFKFNFSFPLNLTLTFTITLLFLYYFIYINYMASEKVLMQMDFFLENYLKKRDYCIDKSMMKLNIFQVSLNFLKKIY